MKQSVFTLKSSRRLTENGVFELILAGDTSAITAPGQFINIELPLRFLRRPISICDWNGETLTLLVKVAGEGTALLAGSGIGAEFDVLSGLGNGFDTSSGGDMPLLVGGGIGIAPIYGLARALLAQGRKPTVILGFRSGEDAFYLDEFTALGCEVLAATEDGSLGTKGFVTHCMKGREQYVFACGPTPMLKAVHAASKAGQFSFEARMGCGFGACVGCSVQTKNGSKRVCKDGPILTWEEIVW